MWMMMMMMKSKVWIRMMILKERMRMMISKVQIRITLTCWDNSPDCREQVGPNTGISG